MMRRHRTYYYESVQKSEASVRITVVKRFFAPNFSLSLAGADIPPFRRPTLTDAKEEYDEIGIDSGPIGFFDLRDYREDYELPALDKDSEALRIVQQWPYEHRREGRVDFGLRGFIFLGTLK